VTAQRLPPRVYVAGPSSDMPRCRAVMRELERRGATVTHDWVAQIERAGGRLPEDRAERRAAVNADLAGVAAADVVLGLLGPPSVGRAHEIGAALMRAALGHPVRVVTSGTMTTPDIWDEHCEHLGDDRAAVRALTARVRSAPAVVERVFAAAWEHLRSDGIHPDVPELIRSSDELLARPRSPLEYQALTAARGALEILRRVDYRDSDTWVRGAARDELEALARSSGEALDAEDHLLALARAR
jgi:hypothetical protein